MCPDWTKPVRIRPDPDPHNGLKAYRFSGIILHIFFSCLLEVFLLIDKEFFGLRKKLK
jgi:hypothetical protein